MYPSQEETNIIVFCRAPVPGHCKTRLVRKYGRLGAAKIAHLLLNNTLHKLLENNKHNLELCCTPNPSHPVFLAARRKYKYAHLACSRQLGSDLGQRMFHAARRMLSRTSFVLLVGTDCPEMTLSYVEKAIGKLQQGSPVVIGPANDGGYVLLGLSVAEPRLFHGIAWGSDQVLKQTLGNCRRLKIEAELLTPLSDIDDPHDWQKWKRKALS